jgi:predicted secreted protein
MSKGAKMGRPIELEKSLADLAEAIGSVEELASMCEVSDKTIRRWNRREYTPSRPLAEFINNLAANRGLKKPFRRVGETYVLE